MLKIKMRLIFSLFSFFLIAHGSWAQEANEVSEAALITDRPTQTYSSFVLPKGAFQIESGFGYSKAGFSNSIANQANPPEDATAETFTLNFLQLRYGLSEKVELRLAQNVFFNREKYNGEVIRTGNVQFASTWIGTKIHVMEEEGILPQTSFLVEYVTDVFDENIGQDLINLRLNFSNALSDKFSLGYGFGGFIPTQNEAFSFDYSVVGSYAFKPDWGAFLEVYGTLRNDWANTHNVDMGFSYLVSNNFQLDAYTGFCLTDNYFETDFIFGFGFSTRILKK